jgi:transposase
MEAGCHSPWISRYLEQLGCEVVVSNPRKTRAIYQHERKSDRRDALMLAFFSPFFFLLDTASAFLANQGT